jgi:hypothetical protein
VEFTSRADNRCRELYRKANPLGKDKDGHSVDDYSATGHEINKERNETVRAATKRPYFCATTCSNANDVSKQHTQGLNTGHITDKRMITEAQLRGKVRENNNLSSKQPEDLCNV